MLLILQHKFLKLVNKKHRFYINWLSYEGANRQLHHLIHTRLKFNLAHHLVICQRKENSPL